MSAISCLMYRSDRIAARSERPRIPEATLHLTDLPGGWPGALVAQQAYRHKTAKHSFQAVFWVTVIINLIAAAWLADADLVTGLAAWLGR